MIHVIKIKMLTPRGRTKQILEHKMSREESIIFESRGYDAELSQYEEERIKCSVTVSQREMEPLQMMRWSPLGVGSQPCHQSGRGNREDKSGESTKEPGMG